MLSFRDYKDRISQSVHYHIENNIPFMKTFIGFIVKNFTSCLEKQESYIMKDY